MNESIFTHHDGLRMRLTARLFPVHRLSVLLRFPPIACIPRNTKCLARSLFLPRTTEMKPDDYNDIKAFHEKLASSRRILALCGAGLSAASGSTNFPQALAGCGGITTRPSWPPLDAFEEDPGLVWLFYAYRRQHGLKCQAKRWTLCLAALARKNRDLLRLTQNVDSEFQSRLCSPLSVQANVPHLHTAPSSNIKAPALPSKRHQF